MADITVTALKERLDKGEKIIIIDVREQYEYEEFNINGQLIPLGTLPQMLEDLADHKEEEIVVHCRSGRRSEGAKQMMQLAGFKNVRNLLGGMVEWQATFS